MVFLGQIRRSELRSMVFLDQIWRSELRSNYITMQLKVALFNAMLEIAQSIVNYLFQNISKYSTYTIK